MSRALSATQQATGIPYRLEVKESVGSTNEEAKKMAAANAPHGTVVWAKQQSAGRGRYDREWISPAGNLYVSILLRPHVNLEKALQLSFVAAVAAQQAVASILAEAVATGEVDAADAVPGFKWPNDILLGGKKLGGILLESSTQSGNMVDWLVVGIGINVEDFPADCEFPATSLAAVGVKGVSPKILLTRLLHYFSQDYDRWLHEGFSGFREQWLHRAAYRGKQISVRLKDKTLQGVFEGIDEKGTLLLRTGESNTERVTAGDVFTG